MSGGVTVNNTAFHVVQEDLPFGGVGPSGMGEYHGRDGLRHLLQAEAGVLSTGAGAARRFLMPPYGRKFRAIVRLLYR